MNHEVKVTIVILIQQHFSKLSHSNTFNSKLATISNVIVICFMKHKKDDQATSLGLNAWVGKVFVDKGPDGKLHEEDGSYHFESLENIYLSYEKWANASLTLDDGTTPVPLRKHFTEVKFPDDGLTFNGKLNWKDEGSTLWDADEWIYNFKLLN